MQKPLKIFIGSTYEDLKEYRKTLLDMFARLQQQVEAMEYWGAGPDIPLEHCLNRVKESSIFIGIIGTRYGEIAKDNKSLSQLEYEEALKYKLNTFMFMIDEEQPVPFKYVDTGDAAEKLIEYRKMASKHMRSKFSGPPDLANTVVISLFKWLDRIGENIRVALNTHGIEEFMVDTGYTLRGEIQPINLAPYILSLGESSYKINDDYIEGVLAAAVMAKQIHEGNFKVIYDFISFKPDVYQNVVALLINLGLDEEKLDNEIRKCDEALPLRLLINIAGRLGTTQCIDSICMKLLVKKYHNYVQACSFPITPFRDIVRIALSRMPPEVAKPILLKYSDKSKTLKIWQAKKVIDKVLSDYKKYGRNTSMDGI